MESETRHVLVSLNLKITVKNVASKLENLDIFLKAIYFFDALSHSFLTPNPNL
jgi:hypothetical protein